MQRRTTRIVNIGGVPLGGHHPIRVQSMTNLPTADIKGQVEQILKCADAGAEYMRITVPTLKDAAHFAEIKKRLKTTSSVNIPLIADIHFSPKVAIEVAKVANKVRINPGNFIKSGVPDLIGNRESGVGTRDQRPGTNDQPFLSRLRDALLPLLIVCKDYGTAIRIGTNHGSLSERIMNLHGDTPEGMVVATMEAIEVCRMENFHNIVISLKSSNVRVMTQATRLFAEQIDAKGWNYPIHLGVTEAGDGDDGRIKSAVGIGSLLVDGIGDTVRVSLTEDPENEIPVAYNILQAARSRITKTDYIACPGCGRTQFGLQETLQKVRAATEHLTGLKIAVMGCIVNGIGEMADADYGYVGAGAGKVNLYKGKEQVRKNIPEKEAIEELLKLIDD